jgi:hypothetical protein
MYKFSVVFNKIWGILQNNLTSYIFITMIGMKVKILLLLTVFTFIVNNREGYCQNKASTSEKLILIPDSLSGQRFIVKTNMQSPEVKLTRDQALSYLQLKYRMSNWNDPGDPLRRAIGELIFFSFGRRFDSTRLFLEKYPYDSINVSWDQFYIWDTMKLKIPVVNPPAFNKTRDSAIVSDRLSGIIRADSGKLLLNTAGDVRQVSRLSDAVRLKDTVLMVATDTLNDVTGNTRGFPFRYYQWPFESDSIKAAINSLIGFVESGDSSIINLKGNTGSLLPLWINSKVGEFYRFWLPNEYSDSVTLWVGSVSRNTLGLYLEDGITFRRPTKQSKFSDARLDLKQIDNKNLQDVKQTPVKPRYWKLRSESAFILSQTSLSNWVKGGEGTISTAMDLTGYADYNNSKRKLSSNNYIRIKYGLVKAGDEKLRKNQDLLESNSKLNHKAFGKFDFSAVLLLKTQISKGYNYPNDSVPVSKFLNPVIITFGLGLDYKPNKTTSINFSPLSYKLTFVKDTGRQAPGIDQTKYGIARDRRLLHEPGASLIITNEFKPFKEITVTNRLQLFTNYTHNPQNIDVDWEMILTSKINWFTDVRFNTHFIFDDDTKTIAYYKNGTPRLGADGKPVKTARVQFKEMIGFTFVFRF